MRARVAAPRRPPAPPVGTRQSLSHFISPFVARLSFVSPLKDTGKATFFFIIQLDAAIHYRAL